MLSTVKEKALAGFNIGANFVEACADRQIGFATYYLQSSLENAKKLRHSKSFSDVVALEKDYLKGMQEQLTELAAANTEALKKLGSSTKEYVSSIVKPPAASVEAAITPDSEKKIVRKSV
ncbi:MAG TPA: phasin family protein [Spongiibacteraceae bacterium]|nr:phasin family protein [Spongiibacteraceae bacterium]